MPTKPNPGKLGYRFIQESAGFNFTPVMEEAPNKKKRWYLQGVFIEADIDNRNGRYYPYEVVAEAVERYKKEFIDTNRSIGELNHPVAPRKDDPNVDLERGCIRVTELTSDGKNFIGKALVSGPLGKVVQGYIEDGTQLGVSTRGLADVDDVGPNKGYIKQWLITAIDVIHHPSAPSALVQGVMEGRRWVCENGLFTPEQIDGYKGQIVAASSRKLEATGKMVFESYMRKLVEASKIGS